MTDLSDPRVPGGGVGKQVTLGGETTSGGSDAGLVVAEIDSMTPAAFTNHPTKTTRKQWAHGNETTPDTLTVAGGADAGNPIDIRDISSDHRQVVIVNSSTVNYTYRLLMGPTALVADAYEVKASAAGGALTPIVIDAATYGYDYYLFVEITPTVSDQDFQVYLAGKVA